MNVTNLASSLETQASEYITLGGTTVTQILLGALAITAVFLVFSLVKSGLKRAR